MINQNRIFFNYIILVLIFTIFILLPKESNIENFINIRDYGGRHNLRRKLFPYGNNALNPIFNNDINSIPSYYGIFYNLPLFRYLENRDRSILTDPLVAPERRVQADQYPYPLIYNNSDLYNYQNPGLYNYPTRGYPDNYQQLGIVKRIKDEKILQLFGRATFPGSNQWEYYVRSEREGFINKIPIKSRNQRELQNDDKVHVPGMNSDNGIFIVELFNYDTPRYNPYTF